MLYYLFNTPIVLQAHLKAAPATTTPKLLKELAKSNSLTHELLPRQLSATKDN